MTTFAPNDSTLDERVRDAWSTYRDDLAELEGRAYDDAEAESWDRLQRALGDIESDRAALERDPGAGA
jgi:hypothetical protein